MIYLSYFYGSGLQGRVGGEEKNPPQQQQLGVLLDLSAIAASKKNTHQCRTALRAASNEPPSPSRWQGAQLGPRSGGLVNDY